MKRSDLTTADRILLVGPPDSGKTHGAVSIMKHYIDKGQRALYIGVDEFSADAELRKLTDKQMELVDLVNVIRGDVITLMGYLNAAIDGTYGVVIVDPVHHIRMFCRDAVRNEFIKKMEYPDPKGNMIPITNPETFTLHGFEYGRANDLEERLVKTIACGKFPVVMTLTESFVIRHRGDPKNWYGFADMVFELQPRPENEKYRKIRLVKDRANDIRTSFADYPEDLWKYLANMCLVK